ncbi:hypothetical protein N478_13655 [Pseudoalteromonas luteoviolacea S4060-1]|uniref:Uncharacterized protein n=1 Tax=Pseudoalteromonas luteoviolacea S4060-1 TaxID=1365257 RepID=A0A167NSD6_9GAMM|nr:hypothetical protein N478_13655 [Pseudoalteromonas luteoviolacea S4060-1]
MLQNKQQLQFHNPLLHIEPHSKKALKQLYLLLIKINKTNSQKSLALNQSLISVFLGTIICRKWPLKTHRPFVNFI